jgi:hypothetical protein
MADRAARIDSKEATQLAGFSLSTAAIGRQRSPRIGPTFGQGSKRAIAIFRQLSVDRYNASRALKEKEAKAAEIPIERSPAKFLLFGASRQRQTTSPSGYGDMQKTRCPTVPSSA